MSEQKLIVVIMGQNCKKFIGMCLEAVKDADAIIYCDGGSIDGTPGIIEKYNTEFIVNIYDQEDKQMNGKQRNFYLEHLKKNYSGYWCLCLDADEILEDDGIKKIRKFINFLPKQNHNMLFSPKMRHLIGDLGHEDSTQSVHFVPNRLFKIRKDLKYPEVEHPVLISKEGIYQNLMVTTIWHLAYCPNMWDIKKRYENHLKKSNMHTPEFLKNWRNAHLFGVYPRKQFDPLELPEIILNEFGISRDELYFRNRGLELKHFQDAIHWKEFFKPESAIEFGCGRGPRVFALNNIGISCLGVEISDYALDNLLYPTITKGNILNYRKPVGIFDLSIAYDVLEHIKYEDLDKAINTLYIFSNKYILVSIPFKGDPNLNADPTHIIKESREWWLQKFLSKGLKEVEVPSHFLYREQLLIFKK